MNGAGEPFGMDRLRDSLESSRGGRAVDAVMAALHAHVGSNAAQDDASILAINLL
jgi:serine phosphatase RsbU (regulator of sigma subunit)